MVTGSEYAQELVRVMDPEGRLKELGSYERSRFRCLLLELAWYGYGRCRIVSARRSRTQQERLYGLGRTERDMEMALLPKSFAVPDAKKVTWVLPCNSKHVSGEAVDVTFSSYVKVRWGTVRIVARNLGLTWGGDWRVRDYGHFEL